MGPEEDVSPQIRTLATARMLDRAHILGAATRLAYVISAAMPGVLPRAPLLVVKDKLVLTLPRDLSDLANERVFSRLKQMARLIGREPVVKKLD
jgi:exopolyphosphatase/guanosine-5'-triphosphate,3'-diphosphate pyrophosphatase